MSVTVVAERAAIEAFDRPENAKRGVIKLDGRLVERQHLGMDRRAVAWSEAIRAKGF